MSKAAGVSYAVYNSKRKERTSIISTKDHTTYKHILLKKDLKLYDISLAAVLDGWFRSNKGFSLLFFF